MQVYVKHECVTSVTGARGVAGSRPFWVSTRTSFKLHALGAGEWLWPSQRRLSATSCSTVEQTGRGGTRRLGAANHAARSLSPPCSRDACCDRGQHAWHGPRRQAPPARFSLAARRRTATHKEHESHHYGARACTDISSLQLYFFSSETEYLPGPGLIWLRFARKPLRGFNNERQGYSRYRLGPNAIFEVQA